MSYSFTLSKPLTDYGRIVRGWSTAECRPYARQADTEHRPPSNWKEILDTAQVGLGRQDIPDAEPIPTFEEGHWVTDLVFHEAVNYGDISVAPVLGGGIGHLVVESMGTPEQIDRWYAPIVKNGLTTAFALTEPQFGSDTSMVATSATRDGDTWMINGSKIYCSGAVGAEYVISMRHDRQVAGSQGYRRIRGAPRRSGNDLYQAQRVEARHPQLADLGAQLRELRHPSGEPAGLFRGPERQAAIERSGWRARRAG